MAVLCGCYNIVSSQSGGAKQYLPQVGLSAHTTVTSIASKTILTQTFVHPSAESDFPQCKCVFPLYDGVSVVGFTCEVGSRTITGVVKAKAKAKQTFNEALARGETAGLLEQGATSDVFITSLGNIPAGDKLLVKLTYVEELKHDMEVDGLRFTLPTTISPRYDGAGTSLVESSSTVTKGKIAIVVDIITKNDSPLQEVRSPSHPIAVTLGRTSTATSKAHHPSRASATLALGSSTLEKDFVLEILHHDSGKPIALLETHHNMQGQRALMTTLVPKTSLHSSKPEVIFVADQSGSMQGKPTQTLVDALRIFLKSLPVGIKFNICFFGSAHKFLFNGCRVYNQESLAEALEALNGLDGNMGGTETLNAVKASIESRDPDEDLSVILATDGDIWRQQELFDYLMSSVSQSRRALRVFSLGIGASVSSALIQGVARAGNGFAQSVTNGEKLDRKVVRLLKGALTADSDSYTMEVQYEQDADDDEFVFVERVTDSLRVVTLDKDEKHGSLSVQLSKEPAASAEPDLGLQSNPNSQGPIISMPRLLQTPHTIPPLYPFNRTTIYILLSPEAPQVTPKSVILRSNYQENPFELHIPVEVLPQPSDTIHQLAAKKAISELEEGRGWLVHAKDGSGTSIKEKYNLQFEKLVEKEAVRLGVQYQIASKNTSFIAVQSTQKTTSDLNQTSLDENVSLEIGITRISAAEQEANNVVQAMQFYSGSHNRTTQKARYSTGGQAPRMQLASQAARKGAPSSGFASAMKGLKQRILPSGSHKTRRHQFEVTRGVTVNQQVGPNLDQDSIDYSDEDLDIVATAPSTSVAAQLPPPPHAQQQQSIQARHLQQQQLHQATQLQQPLYQSSLSQQSPYQSFQSQQPLFQSRQNQQPQLQPNWAEDEQKEEDQDPLHALIALQTFSGYWELSTSLLTIINVSSTSAQDKAPKALSSEQWATMFAISFLERKMSGEMETWEMIVEKAKSWLSSVSTSKDEEMKGYWASATRLIDGQDG